jgi:hypothetical protein
LVVALGPENAWFVPLAQLRNSDNPMWVARWHRYLNDLDDPGAVLAVGDSAVFDLTPKVFYNTCFDDCLFEQWVKDKSPAEIRRQFAAKNIRYVLVNWAQIAQFRKTYGFCEFVQPEVFDRLEREGILAKVQPAEGNSRQLYRVVGNS